MHVFERRCRRRDDRSRVPQNRRRAGTPAESTRASSWHSTLCRNVASGSGILPVSRDHARSLCCCCWCGWRIASLPEVEISRRPTMSSSSSSVTSSANRMSTSSTVNVTHVLLDVYACVSSTGTGSSKVTSFASSWRRVATTSCSERLRSGELVRDWWWMWSRPAAETVAMTTGGLRATEEAESAAAGTC